MRTWLLKHLVLTLVTVIRRTCPVRFHNDPRPALREQGVPYIFAFLHGHQMNVMGGIEANVKAMVSRSRDGELIVEALRRVGCQAVRGSKQSSRQDRGGREAIEELVEHLQDGGRVAIAVDGPRGPRGRVHKGVALISQRSGAPVLLVVAKPDRRLIAKRAWDRMQIPLPFTSIHGHYATPVFPEPGEKLETYRRRIESVLLKLEQLHDPGEAVHNPPRLTTEAPATDTDLAAAEVDFAETGSLRTDSPVDRSLGADSVQADAVRVDVGQGSPCQTAIRFASRTRIEV